MGTQNSQRPPALASWAVTRQARAVVTRLIPPSPNVVHNSPGRRGPAAFKARDTLDLQSMKFNHAFRTIEQAKTLEQALPGVNVLRQACGYAPRAIADNDRPDEGAGTAKQPCTSLEHQRDAACGPARERVLAGEPVDRVASAQGIEKGSVAYHMLEDIAVEGPAKARILAGEPVGHVASAHGIEKDSDQYHMLGDIALERQAKVRVIAGERVDQVAGALCIERGSGLYCMLERAAAGGPAKARILAGERVDEVARSLGIEKGSGPYCMLEHTAVEGPAKDRILAGEPVVDVARALGIEKGSSAYCMLERMA